MAKRAKRRKNVSCLVSEKAWKTSLYSVSVREVTITIQYNENVGGEKRVWLVCGVSNNDNSKGNGMASEAAKILMSVLLLWIYSGVAAAWRRSSFNLSHGWKRHCSLTWRKENKKENAERKGTAIKGGGASAGGISLCYVSSLTTLFSVSVQLWKIIFGGKCHHNNVARSINNNFFARARSA